MVTIGEKLQEARLSKNLSLEEISKETKIKAEFLKYIEGGEYAKLPSSSYAQGFVRNYVKYLGLPEKESLALFRREFDHEKAYKVMPNALEVKEEFPMRIFKLRQTFFIISIIFILLFCYILFSYRYAFISPPLSIDYPKDKQTVTTTNIVVKGKTEPNATVYINKEVVSIDSGGNFEKTINVFPGNFVLDVKAVNKFGKTSHLTERIQVKTVY